MLKSKFYPEDEGRNFLRNNDYVPENVASHARTPQPVHASVTYVGQSERWKAVPRSNRQLVLVIRGLMHSEGTALSAGHNTP